MAFSKADLYSNQEKRRARISNALAHPARVRILNQLKYGEMPFQRLVELHPISKASLSTHLRTLRLAGLIEFSYFGRTYVYSNLPENFPNWLELMLAGMKYPDTLSEAA